MLNASDEEVGRLRAHFEEHHWLALPGFLDPALLDTLRRRLAATEFVRVDRRIGSELRPADTAPYFALELLLNSPALLRLVPRLTGCARAVCFTGRIYRRLPGAGHFNRWHTDSTEEGQLVALSVNLSEGVYRGGTTQMREAASKRMVCELTNTGFGDAIMFRVDPRLEHRVLEVEGDAPKTALAGWFKSKPDPNYLFSRGSV